MENYKRVRVDPFYGASGRAYGRLNPPSRFSGIYGASGSGASRVVAVRYGRRRPGRRTGPGFTRRVGFYGRFGTGRGNNAQIEKKFYDTALTLGATALLASTTNATGQLNVGLLQNATATGRVGQKITLKSIQIKLACTLAAGAVDTDIAHIWLVQDTQCNGAAATAADVFVAVGAVGNQMRNVENGARFKILKHFVFRMNADAGVAAAFGGDFQQQECFLQCNIPVTYNAATGAITEIKTNNLFFVYGSTAATATTSGVARLRYTDR